MNIFIIFFILFINQFGTFGLDINELTIIIQNQNSKLSYNYSDQLYKSIIEQSLLISIDLKPNIYITNKHLKCANTAWTIFPILYEIKSRNLIDDHTKWIILCTDHSEINLKILLDNLKDEKNNFIGFPLYDREATIIHHFAHHENPKSFLYPLISAGVILNKKILDLIKNPEEYNIDFSIDAQHEFAQYVWDNGNGYMISKVNYLCPYFYKDKTKCAIYDNGPVQCKNPSISINDVIFGVKTCFKFHNERMPVILKTWGQYTKYIRYFSDKKDESIPTIDIGVENTERGHCEKTLRILKYLNEEIKNYTNIQWIVLADDDTILSVSRLLKFLSCFRDEEYLYLGERYGYQLSKQTGFNYVTGGGGIVFNRKTIKIILQNCFCPNNDSPDDMIIGNCLNKLNISAIHSSLFHQARANDYPPEVLYKNDVISFHKFWLIDPYTVYNKWFRDDDIKLTNESCIIKKNINEEL